MNDLNRDIEQLAGEVELFHPERLVAVMRAYPQATAQQIDRLWRIAVRQKALADFHTTVGTRMLEAADWQLPWTSAEEVLRKSLTDSVTSQGFVEMLRTYAEHSRASVAMDTFLSKVRQLETLLEREMALLGFHFEEQENEYRKREARLADRLASPETSTEERSTIAQNILDERGRYQNIYSPKLDGISGRIKRLFRECEMLLPFFSDREYPHVHKWRALTLELLDCRVAEREHVASMLSLDGFMPNETLSGDMTITTIDGKETATLGVVATEQFKVLLQRTVELLATGAQRENAIREERRSVVQQIINEPTPQEAGPSADERQTSLHAPNPLERAAWYRLAKLCWWIVAGVWLLLSAAIAETPSAFAIAALIGAAILYAIKSAVFYVVLGRTTLREPAGSGFVDIDGVEQLMFEQNVARDDQLQRELDDLRRRYGRRVPVDVVKGFVDNRLALIRKQKRQLLADADREGKALSVESLRAKLLADRPAGMSEDERLLMFDTLLLRLEVKYGPEIPMSAADAEAEALEAS